MASSHRLGCADQVSVGYQTSILTLTIVHPGFIFRTKNYLLKGAQVHMPWVNNTPVYRTMPLLVHVLVVRYSEHVALGPTGQTWRRHGFTRG